MKDHARDAWGTYGMTIAAVLSASITNTAVGPLTAVFIIASALLPWCLSHDSKRHPRSNWLHEAWRSNSDTIYVVSMFPLAISLIVSAHRLATANQAFELAMVVLGVCAVELIHHRLRNTQPRNADRYHRGGHAIRHHH